MGNESPNNSRENDNSDPNKSIKLNDKDKKDNKKNIPKSSKIKNNNIVPSENNKNNDINNLIEDFYNFRDSANNFAVKIIQEISTIKEEQNNIMEYQNKIREEITIIRQILENNNSNKEINKIPENKTNFIYKKENINEKEKEKEINNSNNIDKKENINEKEKEINNTNDIDKMEEDIQNTKINYNLKQKNNIEIIKSNLKSNNKYKFNYLIINDELENDLIGIIRDSIIKQEFKLNPNIVFERQEIQSENQNIYSKLKKHLATFLRKEQNYMLKKAQFLKNVGYLVRFSHEISNFMEKYLLNMFKEQVGFHSVDIDTIRLYFASWIKKLFNMKCFFKIINNPYILAQIDFLNLQENTIFKEIFPVLIKLYFLCYLTDVKVEVIYAKEDMNFDIEIMTDDLYPDPEIEKKVLFTFLPGLYCNKQFFENATIHIVTYKTNNPDQFQFQKPIFTNIKSLFIPDLEIKVDLCYEIIKKNKSLDVKFEIITNPDILWDTPKYIIYLLRYQNWIYPIEENSIIINGFEEENYGECICKVIVNKKEFTSKKITLDLRKNTNKIYK